MHVLSSHRKRARMAITHSGWPSAAVVRVIAHPARLKELTIESTDMLHWMSARYCLVTERFIVSHAFPHPSYSSCSASVASVRLRQSGMLHACCHSISPCSRLIPPSAACGAVCNKLALAALLLLQLCIGMLLAGSSHSIKSKRQELQRYSQGENSRLHVCCSETVWLAWL